MHETLEQQLRAWPRHLEGAAKGNPYATMCLTCHGRHAPPRDHLCLAIATEARRAETLQDGSVHEGAGLKGIAQTPIGDDA